MNEVDEMKKGRKTMAVVFCRSDIEMLKKASQNDEYGCVILDLEVIAPHQVTICGNRKLFDLAKECKCSKSIHPCDTSTCPYFSSESGGLPEDCIHHR